MSKICVAMSGGVDSSVAAALLVEQGRTVFGAYMKNWSLEQEGVQYKPWQDDAHDAEEVCKQLNIPFHVFDFEQEYQKRVVNAFVGEYAKGRTPNPDVLCNKEVKFDLFLERARSLGAEYIATGHYARVSHDGQSTLLVGVDQDKDQSYFLYTLTQKELPHVLFPIGHLRKSEVRTLAQKYGLVNAAKKDSQGICFIGPVSMRTFLQNYLKPQPGEVVTPSGEVLGTHQGVIFYTEGQRHGFGTKGSHEPLYVAEKRLASNELVVVSAGDPLLQTTRIVLEDVTWTGQKPTLPGQFMARVRYRHVLHEAEVIEKDGQLEVIFEKPVNAVSCGQSTVLYQNDRVIGGGVVSQRQ